MNQGPSPFQGTGGPSDEDVRDAAKFRRMRDQMRKTPNLLAFTLVYYASWATRRLDLAAGAFVNALTHELKK